MQCVYTVAWHYLTFVQLILGSSKMFFTEICYFEITYSLAPVGAIRKLHKGEEQVVRKCVNFVL